ncbi:MAG: ABC transporter ATP-binding protein, partial [Candidatus Eremiobacteraeota bacterium]|nr:ABC transporter ATP-binding protein [Candidatus Eremiobacteraeota bacterium]
MSAPILSLSGVEAYYGRIQALRGLSLDVGEGEIVALIGANGAGKTTTLRTISGLLAPARGSINLFGESIVGMRADQIVRKGIVQSPEGRRIFPRLTVLENLRLGAYARTDRAIAGDFDRVLSLFPRLGERLKQKGGTLSGGEQQMLAIGRALMSRPRLVMFDEPSLGLAPNIVERTFAIIRRIRDSGTTVLLVEQNAFAALDMCDHAYLLESGRIVLSGS